MTLPASKKFAIDRGEKVSDSVWSQFETIVIHEISLLEAYQDAKHVLKLYNDLVFYSQAPYCMFILPENTVFREKSYSQICAKLQYIKCKSHTTSVS